MAGLAHEADKSQCDSLHYDAGSYMQCLSSPLQYCKCWAPPHTFCRSGVPDFYDADHDSSLVYGHDAPVIHCVPNAVCCDRCVCYDQCTVCLSDGIGCCERIHNVYFPNGEYRHDGYCHAYHLV